MSLTSILKRESDRKNLKLWFRENFPIPDLDCEKKIIVKGSDLFAPLIGMGFDYFFRFKIKQINKDVEEREWIALIVFETIVKTELSDCLNPNKNLAWRGMNLGIFISRFIERLHHYKISIKRGTVDSELIRFSLVLATLEQSYRTGSVFEDLNRYFSNAYENIPIETIKKLHKAINWKQFKTKEKCFLNPVFGEGSELVDGADADIIIGDTLIDIKTTKHLELTRADLNQVIGYSLLSFIGKINGKHDSPIKKIGIYFARFDYLWTCPLSVFFEEQEFKTRIVNEFQELIKDKTLKISGKQKGKGRDKRN